MRSVHEYLIRWRGPKYIAKKGGEVEKSLLIKVETETAMDVVKASAQEGAGLA